MPLPSEPANNGGVSTLPSEGEPQQPAKDPATQGQAPATTPTPTASPSSPAATTCQGRPSDQEDKDKDDEAKVSNEDAKTICAEFAKKKVRGEYDGIDRLVGDHGQAYIRSDKIDEISDHHSQLVVTGKTGTSMIRLISNVSGRTIICNAVVDSIEMAKGRVILVNSVVNRMKNSSGRVDKINSIVKE